MRLSMTLLILRAIATVGIVHAACAGPVASAAELPELTYDEIRTLVKEAVEAQEIAVEDPAVIRRSSARSSRVYVQLGGPPSLMEFFEYPDRDAIEIQLRLELLRERLFEGGEEKEFVAAACQAAERQLAVIVKTSRGKRPSDREAVEAMSAELWVGLHRRFAEFFSRRNEQFGGFIEQQIPKPWTLKDDGSAWIPLPLAVVAYSSGPPVEFAGPRGVVVNIMTQFTFRVMTLKRIPPSDWPWKHVLDLNPDSPPSVYLEVDAPYHIQITRGDQSTSRSKAFRWDEFRYEVPLPE